MKNNKKRILAAACSIFLLAVTVTMLWVMNLLTKYLPYMLSMFVLLLPIALNVVIIIFGKEILLKDPVETDNSDEKQKFLKSVVKKLCKFGRALATLYNKIRKPFTLILIPAITVGVHIIFWIMTKRVTSVYKITYISPVIFVVMFVLFIIFGKWCNFARSEKSDYLDNILHNLSTVFGLAQLTVLLLTLSVMLKLLGIYEAQKILVYALCVVICYETVFIITSLTVKLIRKEFFATPDISIPIPFVSHSKDTGVLSYLEKNTGITMRSLWSMQLIKQLIPYAVMSAAILFWLATGIVQIESYQEGAHYRMGKLRDEPLEPGLHLTLPWPFDKVEVYNTETVSKITIGYTSSERTDNTWTGNHGNSEYKLLMGSGDELCSINLRIEYNISDLNAYLKTSAAPDKLLESKAYELITERTISTDLNSILSVDRSEFAESFKVELIEEMSKYEAGINVVSVVLESIHPPVEVAEVYQKSISAGIDAQSTIYTAEAQATVKIESSRKEAYTAEQNAYAEKYTSIAAARADVAEFMASVNADNVDSSAYRYYKYLTAITKAYGNAKIVIVGEGIDASNIYFGNVAPLE